MARHVRCGVLQPPCVVATLLGFLAFFLWGRREGLRLCWSAG